MTAKFLFLKLALLLLISCKDNTTTTATVKSDSSSHNRIKQDLINVVPDTTINGLLILENNRSLERFYKDSKTVNLTDYLRQTPVAIFRNRDKSQYLLASQYEGGTKNNFSYFEIGYFGNDEKLDSYPGYVTNDEIFETESKLKLGISLEELILIKGDGYKLTNDNYEKVVTYRINDYENSIFLKKYRMPGYTMEFRLQNNKVKKIFFGFDYP